jgi:hypothetical protein
MSFFYPFLLILILKHHVKFVSFSFTRRPIEPMGCIVDIILISLNLLYF